MCDVSKLKKGLRHCDEQAIAVYIMYKGRRIGLCERCWGKVSRSSLEWGNNGDL